MITNFTTDEETKFVSGTYNGEEFSIAPKFSNGELHALTEDETLEKLQWIDTLPDTSNIELKTMREVRNRKLAETDWWASSDLTMTAEQTAYRQALRDITDTYSSLDEVVWPTKP